MPKYIRKPTGDRLQTIIQTFEDQCGLPQVGGAIDGSHIPIKAPTDEPDAYYNRKGFHSIVLQAVVDCFLTFTDVFVGYPGRVHDARVLANSGIFLAAQSAGTAFPGGQDQVIDGIRVPVLLLGDPAYPLQTWLMKPYPESRITNEQMTFNYRLSRARVVVERAIGILKQRWRILLHAQEASVRNICTVVCACCTLHNYCIARDDHLVTNDGEGPPRPQNHGIGIRRRAAEEREAKAVREALTHFLCQ